MSFDRTTEHIALFPMVDSNKEIDSSETDSPTPP